VRARGDRVVQVRRRERFDVRRVLRKSVRVGIRGPGSWMVQMLARIHIELIVRLDSPLLQLLHVLPVLDMRVRVFVAIELIIVMMMRLVIRNRHRHWHVMMMMRDLKRESLRRYPARGNSGGFQATDGSVRT